MFGSSSKESSSVDQVMDDRNTEAFSNSETIPRREICVRDLMKLASFHQGMRNMPRAKAT